MPETSADFITTVWQQVGVVGMKPLLMATSVGVTGPHVPCRDPTQSS